MVGHLIPSDKKSAQIGESPPMAGQKFPEALSTSECIFVSLFAEYSQKNNVDIKGKTPVFQVPQIV